MSYRKYLPAVISIVSAATCTLAASSEFTSDAEFKSGLKAEVPLSNCKKMGGVVEKVVGTVVMPAAGGGFVVYLSGDATPDGVSGGKFRKVPTQQQLDSLKGQRFCYVG